MQGFIVILLLLPSSEHVIYDLVCELIGENPQLTRLNMVVKYLKDKSEVRGDF